MEVIFRKNSSMYFYLINGDVVLGRLFQFANKQLNSEIILMMSFADRKQQFIKTLIEQFRMKGVSVKQDLNSL